MLRLFRSLRDWLNRRIGVTIHGDPDYQKAHEFKDTFSPKEGVDYDWIEDYARLVYDRFDKAEQTLDAKAESIIKFLGGGTGLLTFGAIVNIQKLGLPVAVALGISLLLAVVAIAIAAWVRLPRQTFLPPSVGWALAYANFYQDAARSKFLAQWHVACEGMRLAVDVKARTVKIAMRWTLGALLALALSFAVAVCTMKVDGKEQIPGGASMGRNSSQNTPPAPDPAGAPQTPDPAMFAEPPGPAGGHPGPDPAVSAEPQIVANNAPDGRREPAQQAEPQSIQYARDGSGRHK